MDAGPPIDGPGTKHYLRSYHPSPTRVVVSDSSDQLTRAINACPLCSSVLSPLHVVRGWMCTRRAVAR